MLCLTKGKNWLCSGHDWRCKVRESCGKLEKDSRKRHQEVGGPVFRE